MGEAARRLKLVIPGGSGQVGTILARRFHEGGSEVVVLGRRPSPAPTPWRVVAWDGKSPGPWAEEFEGADAVINLAGRSVNCRYSTRNRIEILDSRVDSTRAVARAIAGAARPPRVWLQAGTATIYPALEARASDESAEIGVGTGPDAWRFSVEVARAWERAVDSIPTPGTRKVILRSAMTMSPDHGGVFDVLLGLARLGLGGRAGDGRQWVSWIHDRDFARAVAWLIEHDEVAGVVNLAAPHPLPNDRFMAGLRAAAGVPFGLPAARWMIEAGALALRTEPELILKSRRVGPARLLAAGFRFDFPAWPEAAADLAGRWKAARGLDVAPARPQLINP